MNNRKMSTRFFAPVLTVCLSLFVWLGTAATPLPTEKATFRVYGNCAMCQKRIEQAAMRLKGVKMANWNKESGELTVFYNTKHVSLTEIHQAIADVGHDTDKVRAADDVYEALHFCCLYERADADSLEAKPQK